MQLIGLVVLDAASAPLFLRFGLPSLLAPGNLPTLAGRLRLRLIGAGPVVEAVQRAPAMAGVRARFDTAFLGRAAADPAAIDCWAAELADPEIRGRKVLRLDPRLVWSDGALSAIAAEFGAGAARVETICPPVDPDRLRAALAGPDAVATAGLLSQLAAASLRRSDAAGAEASGFADEIDTAGGLDLVRPVGPTRLAVHCTEWDVVGEIAAGREHPVAFLNDASRVLAVRAGRYSGSRPRRLLIRELAASPAARDRFGRVFNIGRGEEDAAALAALQSERAEIEAAVQTALSRPQRRLLLAAWTRPYVELFLRLSLPSLLSPGNLPQLEADGNDVAATMLCLSGDRPLFESAPRFRGFAAARAVEWQFLDAVVAVLGDAREAVLSAGFRAAMARHCDPAVTFVLVKPGQVMADGTLPSVLGRIDAGARAVLAPTPTAPLAAVRERLETNPRGLTSRALAMTVTEDDAALPGAGLAVRAGLDQIVLRRGPGWLQYRAARWHPAALRPQRPVEAGRQSLIDAEIVPEFAADEAEVDRLASSDEGLIVDARPPAVGGGVAEAVLDELAGRIALWATAWHRCNFAAVYDLIGAPGADLGTVPEPIWPAAAPALPARRHPAWLEARGLRAVNPQLGAEKRYQSDLDGYYRVSRLAIESAEAEEVIYAGHASHVFAPLLARRFERAYIAQIDRVLLDPGGLRDPECTTLYALQLDIGLFGALCLSGAADRFFLDLAEAAQPAVLIVESPDSHGGLADLHIASSRAWQARIARAVEPFGMLAVLQSTLVEFFDGHPGFVFRVMPKSAVLALPPPTPAVPAAGNGGSSAEATAMAATEGSRPARRRTGLFGRDRLDFEILIPVWGERYVSRFAALGLRSLLAPGNLPWLARHHRVHVTILTAAGSRAYFEAQPAFRQLAELAEIAYVDIDDLITAYMPNYSVVLTRAFNRAMALSQDMLGCNFVFLVGDLVFADGALKTVAAAMAEGHAACLMCSPRAAAESLEPVLAGFGDETVLALSSRTLAELLLDHMHPTLTAKIVDGDGVRLPIAQQFFWRPQADTLVSRCFLLHMLSIRPTRRPRDIASPCDFSFVSELAPDGRYHYLTDSDAFLALEVQDSGHETSFVTTHPLTPSEMAEALSSWTTAQHRRFVEASFVFRARQSAYVGAAELTQPYIDRLLALLPPPCSIHRHRFWLGAIGAEVLPKPRDPALLDGADGVQPVMRRLLLRHIAALPAEAPALGVVVAERPGPLDMLLARYTTTAIRIRPSRFYEVAADVAGPEGPLIVAGTGELRDFLELFGDRVRLASLAQSLGPGRTAVLGYAVEPAALRQGEPSRKHLRSLYALALPVFARFGLTLWLHDLADSPFDGRHGFVIEIPGAAAAVAAGPCDDPLLGYRGPVPAAPPPMLPNPPAEGYGSPLRRFADRLRLPLRTLLRPEPEESANQ